MPHARVPTAHLAAQLLGALLVRHKHLFSFLDQDHRRCKAARELEDHVQQHGRRLAGVAAVSVARRQVKQARAAQVRDGLRVCRRLKAK